jgi:3-oxoacyl-[acyl-carrier protein] reductase
MYTIDLTGKNAIITGGTRGIGGAISQLFAETGANTYALYLNNTDAAKKSLAERRSFGGRHRNYQVDVADTESIAAFGEQIESDGIVRVDFLILNAGIGLHGELNTFSIEQWQQLFNTNLTSAFQLSKLLLPKMGQGGSIVSIASGAGHDGLPGLSAYGASKAGLIKFTEALAQDIGPRGIRANVVSPGFTETTFGGKVPTEERLLRAAAQTALRRVGQPNDIANVVLFLCSDLAGFVTGQAIRVNGGVV